MDRAQKNTIKFLSIFFIIISIFSVFYASFSQRGLYIDASFYLTLLLNNIAENKFSFIYDPTHPRVFVLCLTELPALIAGIFFKVSDKITLATIYSFTQFILPILGLWWNYELTKRTKQYSVLFWSIFSFCCLILLTEIYSIVEFIAGLPFQFVLLNYLLGKIHYSKFDKFAIFLLIILMFGVYEYTIFIGFLMFIAMFTTLFETEDSNDLLVKIIIGAGSLAASVYTFIFLLLNSSGDDEIPRFISEALNFWINIPMLNVSITVVTILFMVLLLLKKNYVSYKLSSFISFIYLVMFLKMITNTKTFISPMFELHARSIVCWLIPIIFMGIVVYRFISKNDKLNTLQKLYIPVLLCGITLTGWQIVHTYFWNINVDYLKKEIASCSTLLYIPEEHEEISSLNNEDLRKYIWKGSYLTTALIFDDNYKIKTLLVHNIDDSKIDYSYYKTLYPILKEGKMAIPYDGRKINLVNKFWDLTEVATALEKYIKENNIDVYWIDNNEK